MAAGNSGCRANTPEPAAPPSTAHETPRHQRPKPETPPNAHSPASPRPREGCRSPPPPAPVVRRPRITRPSRSQPSPQEAVVRQIPGHSSSPHEQPLAALPEAQPSRQPYEQATTPPRHGPARGNDPCRATARRGTREPHRRRLRSNFALFNGELMAMTKMYSNIP